MTHGYAANDPVISVAILFTIIITVPISDISVFFMNLPVFFRKH